MSRDHVGILGQVRKGFDWGNTGPTSKGKMVANDFPRLVLIQLLLVPQQQTWRIPIPFGTGKMLSFEDTKVLQRDRKHKLNVCVISSL